MEHLFDRFFRDWSATASPGEGDLTGAYPVDIRAV